MSVIDDKGLLESVASSPMDDDDRMGGKAPPAPKSRKTHPLDSEEKRNLLLKLQDWFDQEWDRQAHNRYQMAIDEDYYDNLQWTEEDSQALMERGQAPVVYNELKPTIDWLLGTERRTRVDFHILPRKKEHGKEAESKTSVMKYLADTNHSAKHRSKLFEDMAIAGLGWLEIGVKEGGEIFERHQPWRQMLYDSSSTQEDMTDARYVFRWKWLDRDVAEMYFPDRKQVLKRAAANNKGASEEKDDVWYLGARVTEPGYDFSPSSVGKYVPYDSSAYSWSRRDRVKVIECWYRIPGQSQRLVGDGIDEPFTHTLDQQSMVNAGQATIRERREMQVRCAIYVDGGLLWEGPSPYLHNRFPFVAGFAHRRRRDNAPYGVVRGLRDIQDGLNKRASKALWILSTNQVEMEEGAVDDIDQLREEASRPDGIIVRNRGREIKIHRENQLAEQHVALMRADQDMIRSISGVNSENLGRQTNAHSGRAIMARQEQGSTVTTHYFDNLRHALQRAGEIKLALVEQYFTEEMSIRVVGEKGHATFHDTVEIDPQTGKQVNLITSNHADFIISQQDYRDSVRQAMYDSLFDIMARLAQVNPQVAFSMLDLVVEMADVPNRDELVARIRKLNGERDPNEEMTPEEIAAEQQKAEIEQMQMQLALEKAQNEVAEIKAKGDKLTADAVAKRLDAVTKALEAAGLLQVNPTLGPPADDVLESAGYTDQTPATQMANEAITQEAMPQPPPEAEQPPGGMGQPMMPEPGMQQPMPEPGMQPGMQPPINQEGEYNA